MMNRKRKADSSQDVTTEKRRRASQNRAVKVIVKPVIGTDSRPEPTEPPAQSTQQMPIAPVFSAPRRRKLAPQRPFPTVPTSVSATGPSSAHKEGKNMICLTRKTPLGAYLRRCKELILKDGYQTLHLSAMGAAIPLLLSLSVALPPILPFSPDEITTKITTGTVTVNDEIIPEDEDEEISYETRGKSTLMIVLKIGDGEFNGDRTPAVNRRHGKAGRVGRGGKGKPRPPQANGAGAGAGPVTFQEPEQPDPSADMSY